MFSYFLSGVGIPAVTLILFVAKATLVLIAALVGTMWLRRGTAGARHLVWLAALVGVLALPLLSRVPSLRLGLLPSSLVSDPATPSAIVDISGDNVVVAPAVGEPPAPPVTPFPPPGAAPIAVPLARAIVAAVTESGRALVVTTAPVAAATPTPPAPIVIAPSEPFDDRAFVGGSSIVTVLLIAWVGVALMLIGWLVAGALSVRRIVAGARELSSPDWTMPLCEVADRLDLEVPPRLVLSDRIEMAFACRATAPTIVLPASAESWTDDRRRAVLFHELAHVKRHDLIGHTLGRVACALYWFHPLVWSAAKHLRAESERACDDLVLSCGARPSDYAQHLLDMVTSVRSHAAPVMALPMARKKEFEGRMLAILDPAVRRSSPGRAQSAAVIAALGTLSLTVAAVVPAAAKEHAVPATPMAMSAPTPPPSELRTIIQAGTAATPQSVPTARLADTDAPQQAERETPELASLAKSLAGVEKAATEAATATISSIIRGRGVTPRAAAQDTGRIALLIRILSTDTDGSVRRAAAWALHDVSTAGARGALAKSLDADNDESVREMSAWSLSEQPGDSVTAALGKALLRDKSSHVRATSAWALGQRDGKVDLGPLESAMSDSSADVRHVAIWAIGNAEIHKAPPKLVAALSDPSPSVRLVAAWALGQIEDTTTMPAISSAFMAETDAHVRSAELRALMMKGELPTNVLEVALKSPDTELRRRAVAMLAGGGEPWPWPWPWPQPRPSP